jgi:hypothetical protein
LTGEGQPDAHRAAVTTLSECAAHDLAPRLDASTLLFVAILKTA